MICERDEYFISTNRNLLDIPRIHRFIAEESYWGKGRTEEVMRKAIANSALCFGLYQKAEKGSVQTGFARVISDLTTFAYLSDVFILSEHRGQGLGKWLINTICEHHDLCNLKRIALLTRTPEFYEPLSFDILDPSDIRKFMTRTSSHQPQQ
jgi:N-acetylglutamate synthase-like GNAT family acetyltransferase